MIDDNHASRLPFNTSQVPVARWPMQDVAVAAFSDKDQRVINAKTVKDVPFEILTVSTGSIEARQIHDTYGLEPLRL